jgi:putative DNA methylase
MGTARAILFCQCVDDPGSVPEEYPTEEEQENERLRLHAIAARLAQWESYSNASLLSMARAEMISTWKRCCNDNCKHPKANKLFNPDLIPGFCDPFSGGGVIPLEAQRMGLTSLALDLNPVSVLINKCLIDFPTRFSGMQPVNPAAELRELSIASQRNGSKGLHEDCLFYGMALGCNQRNGY